MIKNIVQGNDVTVSDVKDVIDVVSNLISDASADSDPDSQAVSYGPYDSAGDVETIAMLSQMPSTMLKILKMK